jgi:WD40 repeat protein
LKKAGEILAKSKQDLKNAEEAQAQANQVFETARKTASEMEKPVHAVTFSRDNQLVLWAGEDGVVRSANADNGQVGERFVSHTGRVLALAALPAGRFVSASADQSAKIWNSVSEWTLKRVIGDGSESAPLIDRVLALDFSPDGKLLASGGGFPSRSGEIKIWNAGDGSLFKEFRDPHSDTVVALDFSPDQKYLASGGADKFLRVFAVESGSQVKAFEGHTHHVQGVSWKRDQRTLASAGADRVIKIWDFASGEQRKTVEGFGKEMTSVQFLLPTKVDKNFEALVSSGDAQVKFVREDGNHTRGFGGAGDFVTSASATPDGGIVVAGALDGVLRVWKGENAESLITFEAPKEEGQLANK